MNTFSSRTIAFPLLVALAGMIVYGCKTERTVASASQKGTSVVGLYSGKGEFTTGGRSLPLEATVEIRQDGTYELLTTLSLFGKEQGTWQTQASTLTLTYVEVPSEPNDRGAQLSSAMKRNIPPRKWTIANDFSELQLNDGPMSITVKRQITGS